MANCCGIVDVKKDACDVKAKWSALVLDFTIYKIGSVFY